MKVIHIQDGPRNVGGIGTVVDFTSNLLNKKGVECKILNRPGSKLSSHLLGTSFSFISSLFSPLKFNNLSKYIQLEAPDVVHIHNLYPEFETSVILICRKFCIPIVMTCHDYRLTCAIHTHFRDGKVCELCNEGREFWCILKNCRSSILKSIVYSVGTSLSRKFRLFTNNIEVVISLTDFSKNRLIKFGFNKDRIVVLPNAVPLKNSHINSSIGEYIAFAGRLSPEKGIDTLISAVYRLENVQVKIAGEGPINPNKYLRDMKNVEFLGRIDREKMDTFYRKARFLVVPSKWFEACPMVILEAMSHGLPVIASRIGGLAEIVNEGVTGFLIEPNNDEDLANKIKYLWKNPELGQKMGRAGRETVNQKYYEEIYFNNLMKVYEKAIFYRKNNRRNFQV